MMAPIIQFSVVTTFAGIRIVDVFSVTVSWLSGRAAVSQQYSKTVCRDQRRSYGF